MPNTQSSVLSPQSSALIREGDKSMFRRYILARKAGLLLALSVLALLVEHPWDLRASTVSGGASALVDAPFGSILPGAHASGQGGADPVAPGNGMAVGP